MLSESDIAELKEAHPLLAHISGAVELKRAGTGVWRGKCPFHIEDSPSFHVNDGEDVYKRQGPNIGLLARQRLRAAASGPGPVAWPAGNRGEIKHE